MPDPPPVGAAGTELFHAGRCERFDGCAVSVGPLIEYRAVISSSGPAVLRHAAVRVGGCGSSSECVIRVVGEFEFKHMSADPGR